MPTFKYYNGSSWVELAKKSDIPSLSGYATQSWVNGKGFLTSHQNIGQATLTSNLGLGSANTSSTWGTLTAANGYAIRWGADQAGGGGMVIAEKSGQTSMQVDGDLYVHEGQDKVATVGQIPSIPSSLPANGGNSDTVDGYHASSFAKIGEHNNLTASGNEFTFASSGFTGDIYLNYRTAGGTNGDITGYILGNGKGGSLGSIIHSGNIGSQYVAYASLAGGVAWANVTGKPSTYTPSAHGHDNATSSAAGFMSATDKTNLDAIVASLNNDDSDSVVNRLKDVLSVFQDYPEGTTVLSALNGKSNTGHTHTKSEITDFPSSLPASDVYSWAKQSTKPSYSWSEITDKPSTFTPASHNHDGTYLKLSGGTLTDDVNVTQGKKIIFKYTDGDAFISTDLAGTCPASCLYFGASYSEFQGSLWAPVAAFSTITSLDEIGTTEDNIKIGWYSWNTINTMDSSNDYAKSTYGLKIPDTSGYTADKTFAVTDDANGIPDGISYLTSAPTAANTSGKLKIVVLSSEPATKYSGYVYIITGS